MAETNRNELYALIYEAVREIPAGSVATYGQIARLVGLPRHARHVGRALAQLDSDSTVPWHRVVNARGQLHQRHGETSRQAQLLLAEGVQTTAANRVSLKHYQWSQL